MRPERKGGFPPRVGRRAGWIVPATLVVAALAFLVFLGPTVSASSYGSGDPVSWSNGTVLCRFAASMPSVAVSQSSLGNSGITVSILNVSEVRPNQSVAASADIAGATWSVWNASTDDAYDLVYSVTAPLSGAGSAELSVSFVLAAYEGSPSGATDAVSVVVSVDNWTWHGSGDHLEMAFAFSPTFPANEHLNATSAPGWLLASTSNANGSVLERVGSNATALATTATGARAPVAANSSLTILSASAATLTVAFGASAGEFTSLAYGARVGVVLPATVVGIPVADFAAVAAAAVLVSLLVAVGVRRVRRRPSKLVYVAEEEER